MRTVIILRTTRIKKVHHLRKTDNAIRAAPMIKSPKYHPALRSRTMYSSACQVMSCSLFAITILYHILAEGEGFEPSLQVAPD